MVLYYTYVLFPCTLFTLLASISITAFTSVACSFCWMLVTRSIMQAWVGVAIQDWKFIQFIPLTLYVIKTHIGTIAYPQVECSISNIQYIYFSPTRYLSPLDSCRIDALKNEMFIWCFHILLLIGIEPQTPRCLVEWPIHLSKCHHNIGDNQNGCHYLSSSFEGWTSCIMFTATVLHGVHVALQSWKMINF